MNPRDMAHFQNALDGFQRVVWEWAQENFGDTSARGGDVVSAALGLAEEAGELCRAVLKQHQGIRGSWEEWQEEIGKELGDVFIKIFDVASRADITVSEVLEKRWDHVSKRNNAYQQGTRLPETS